MESFEFPCSLTSQCVLHITCQMFSLISIIIGFMHIKCDVERVRSVPFMQVVKGGLKRGPGGGGCGVGGRGQTIPAFKVVSINQLRTESEEFAYPSACVEAGEGGRQRIGHLLWLCCRGSGIDGNKRGGFPKGKEKGKQFSNLNCVQGDEERRKTSVRKR